MTVCPRDTLLHSRPKLSFLLLAKQEFRHLPEKCQGSPFLLYIPPDGFPTRNQRNVCAAARSALQDTGEARADKRRPARAVSSRSFGTPEFLPVMESEESPLCLPRQTLVRPARPYLNPPSFTYLLYTSRLSPYIVSRVLLSAGHAVRICRTQRSVIVS